MQATKEAELLYRSQGHEASAYKAVRKQCYLHFLQGKLDGVLEKLTSELLPAFERLGDEYERAETLDLVADILEQRGDLDEALRIRTKEQLPVYERLGDLRERAVTWGNIGRIHYQRGDLDEALRILTDEELPVYEKLGGVRKLLVARANVAQTLLERNGRGDREEATRLLGLALDAARRLRIREAAKIERILEGME